MKTRKTLEKNLVLEIQPDAEGVFKSRPNRYLGIVDIVNPYAANTETVNKEILKEEKVHILDPGRLEDILYPGNRVLLKKAENKNRKTKGDLIAGDMGETRILTNSGYHRKIAEWAIKNKVVASFEDVEKIFPEQRFGESRLDFLLEKRTKGKVLESDVEPTERMGVEVKSCTLSREGVYSLEAWEEGKPDEKKVFLLDLEYSPAPEMEGPRPEETGGGKRSDNTDFKDIGNKLK